MGTKQLYATVRLIDLLVKLGEKSGLGSFEEVELACRQNGGPTFVPAIIM